MTNSIKKKIKFIKKPLKIILWPLKVINSIYKKIKLIYNVAAFAALCYVVYGIILHITPTLTFIYTKLAYLTACIPFLII